MSYATPDEKYFVSLVNSVRRDLGLGELRIERNLNESAENHSLWMLESNVFSHTGRDGSRASDRVRDAGFDMEGQSWWVGENIAYVSVNGNVRAAIDTLHRMLMDSPGHYANIVSERATLIGIGLEIGTFTRDGRDHTVLMATQNFADTTGTPLLDVTGFVIADLPDIAKGMNFETWSQDFSGNVHETFDDGGVVFGGNAGDMFRLGDGQNFATGGRGSDWMAGGSGNDTLSGGAGDDMVRATAGNNLMHGGNGNDVVMGGTGNDVLIGGNGNDRIFGGNGNDRIFGGRGNDTLLGGEGHDRIYAGSGNNVIDGGKGDDLLVSGTGKDTFIFRRGDGNDEIRQYVSGQDRILAEARMLGDDREAFESSRMRMDGDDVVISWIGGGTLRIEGDNLSISAIVDDIFAF